jgi:hypothetical protein
MDLSTEDLVAALAVTSGQQPDDIAEIVELVRKAEPNFAATLFSAWQAEGIELSPTLREEVDEISGRIEFYRSVAARLLAEVGSLTTIKGLEVGALYPPGLVRYQSDLDFITFSEPDLWRAVSLLTGDGWTADTATFSYLGGRLRMVISVRKPSENPFRSAYQVELATYYTLGNQGGIPPIIEMPDRWLRPPVKNTIMLLHERYEQKYRARDVVDAALLHRSMSEADRRALQDAIVSLNLVLAYSELIKLINAAGLGPLAPLPGGLLTTAKAAVTRAARGTSFFTRPVSGAGRHLQRRLMMAKPSRAEGVLWDLVQRRLHPASAIRAGLLGFGLRVTGPRSDETVAVLRERGEHGWVDTPAGRFLLTIGDYVSETAVEDLSVGEGNSNEVNRDEVGDLTA